MASNGKMRLRLDTCTVKRNTKWIYEKLRLKQ